MSGSAQAGNAAGFAAVIGGLPHAAWLVELGTRRVVAANAAAGVLLNRPVEALVGAAADTLATSPEDLAWWAAAAGGHVEGLHSDTLVCVADGPPLPVGRSIGLVGTDHALVVLCDRRAEERVLEGHEQLLATLQSTLESTADGILVTDPSGGISAFNRRFAEMWALPAALLETRDDNAVGVWMERQVSEGAAYAGRLRALSLAPLVIASDRLLLERGVVFERVTRPLLRHGRPQGRVWSFRDLSDRIAAKEQIEALSLTDALTQLPNRRALAQTVESATARAHADGSCYALLVIDLDRFRQINDSLGHEVGDQVLQAVACRLQGCLRNDDVLFRIGGDQFAVLLQPADAGAAEATARRVLNTVAQPCTVSGAPFTLTCSIGIALAPSQGEGIDELSRHAEGAMRNVKAAGRAHVRMHEARGEGDQRQRMQLDQAMRQALVSGRFRLHYQPQVNLSDGRIVGVEALLRWRDPEFGEVPPGRFIPVAEESGFIVPIGDWVLGQAVRQAAIWNSRGHAMPVAINVSALQFQQPHFVGRVAGVLAVAGLAPHLLELELTESILVRDADEALQRLHALARLGVNLSIDDFGTGYSSLAYLKRFPIDKLKIDRSFIAGLPGDEKDTGIVRAILQMARALKMKVVAEGVETEPQRQFLEAEGCDHFQGWLYAPALDNLSFEQRWAQSLPAVPLPPAPAAARRIRLVSG